MMINQIWHNVTYYFRCFKKNNKPDYIKCMYTSTYNDNSDNDNDNDNDNSNNDNVKDSLGVELECGKIHPSQFPTFAFVMSRD